jgi:DNA-binding response OmpR family regulator
VARDKLKQRAYDLVIVDAQMPVIDGLMFCRELRLRGHKEPIVVYSAGALPEDRNRGLSAGADAYVVKPDNSQLIGTVRMLLSRSDISGGGTSSVSLSD